MTFDIAENIRHHGFKRLLLAVSGGLDSICLAHYFIENREALGIEWIGIAHVHHGLREGTADRDAAFVAAFAKSHEIPFFLKRLDGKALKAANGSLEENARDARYKALVEVVKSAGMEMPAQGGHDNNDCGHGKEIAIVTAHHAGDQSETMYMRLRRGTTLAGLHGIQEVRALDSLVTLETYKADRVHENLIDPIVSLQDDKSSGSFGENHLRTKNSQPQREQSDRPHTSYLIFRPFLNVTRAELLDYAREHNLTWCEDESNTDVKFARNSIRHQLLPHLEKEIPGATKQLCKIAGLADRAYAKVMRKCENVFEAVLCTDIKERRFLNKSGMPVANGNVTGSFTASPFRMTITKGNPGTESGMTSFIALDKKKLNKILQAHKDADLSEMFRLWLSEKGFRFPIGFFYAPKEPAHVKIPVRSVYRRRSIVKIRHTVWICEFKDAETAAKFVSCEMKEKDYNEST